MKPKQLQAILNQLPQNVEITRIFIEQTCIPTDDKLQMYDKVIIHDNKEHYETFHVLNER